MSSRDQVGRRYRFPPPSSRSSGTPVAEDGRVERFQFRVGGDEGSCASASRRDATRGACFRAAAAAIVDSFDAVGGARSGDTVFSSLQPAESHYRRCHPPLTPSDADMTSVPCFIPAARGLLLRRALGASLRTRRPHLPPHTSAAARQRAPVRACANATGSGAGEGPVEGPGEDFDADAAMRAFDDFLDGGGLEPAADRMNRKEARKLAKDKEDEFRQKAHERRLDVLTALPDNIVVQEVAEKCPGCGCGLQSADEGMPGFLPMEIREERALAILRKDDVKAEEEKSAADAAAEVEGEVEDVEGAQVVSAVGGEEEEVEVEEAAGEAAEEAVVVVEETAVEEETGIPGLNARDLAELRGILVEEGIELEGESGGGGVDGKKDDSKVGSVVCQRCFRLNNYGLIEDELRVESPRKLLERTVVRDVEEDRGVDTAVEKAKKVRGTGAKNVLTPATFRENLVRLKTKPSVIVYLVDVFDFHGTFLSGLRDIIGDRSPVILAVNKVDLLPKDYKPDRVERWVRHESTSLGLDTIQAVHLVSSRSGTGVKALLADALALARKRKCDIYVVGAANVGKSSFINNVMSIKMRRAESNATKRGERNKAKAKKRGKGSGTLTTSVIPGTTLDVIRVPLDRTVSLYDTPGIIMKHQLTNSLTAPELRAVLPARSVERVTLRLGEGKALFLGGLARIEVVEGRPFFFTAFVSSDVKVHPGRSEDAEEFTKAHVGELLKPPYEADRLEELGEWTSKEFTAEGDGWQRACVDIVLSGLGWVSVTGAGNVRLRVCTPKGVGIFTRDSLMPFEVKVSGASRYTGTRSINIREENRAERKKKQRRRDLDTADYGF